MSIDQYTTGFIKRSQHKIAKLKRKLEALSIAEKRLEKEERKVKQSTTKAAQEVKMVLSVESVAKSTMAVLLVIGGVYVLDMIRDVIILFLVALFLAATFNPSVDNLERKGLPRWLGIIVMYVLVLGAFVLLFSNLVPIIATQIEQLAYSLRDMILGIVNGDAVDSWIMARLHPFASQIWQNVDQAQLIGTATSSLRDLSSHLTSFAGNAIGAVFTVFNGIFNLLLVLIITFFMVVNRKHTSDFFHSLFPHKYSGYISMKMRDISQKIGEWVRGQIILALAMAALTFIVFSVLGLNYALTLSMLSGLGEFIPYLGPFITFASAALIALNQDPVLLLWLIFAYMIVQFIESNILVPLILGHSVGLNPVVVLFALLCGATIGVHVGGSVALGLVGMIIAIPTANIITLFLEEYTVKNK